MLLNLFRQQFGLGSIFWKNVHLGNISKITCSFFGWKLQIWNFAQKPNMFKWPFSNGWLRRATRVSRQHGHTPQCGVHFREQLLTCWCVQSAESFTYKWCKQVCFWTWLGPSWGITRRWEWVRVLDLRGNLWGQPRKQRTWHKRLGEAIAVGQHLMSSE